MTTFFRGGNMAGRKGKYETHVKPYLADITKWRETMDEKQIAQKLGIGKTAFYEYKRTYTELADALKSGEQELGKKAISNLIKRADGYDYTETKEVYERQFDINGEVVLDESGKPVMTLTRKEVHKKHQPGDVGANIILAKNYVEGFSNDPIKDAREAERLQMEKDKNDLNSFS